MLKPTVNQLLAFLFVLALVPKALGQFSFGDSQPERPKRVAASLAVYEGVLSPGSSGAVGVLLEVEDNWKIQAGKGSGDETRDSIPTEVELMLPEGWIAGEPLWPEAKPFTVGEGEFALSVKVYEGRTLIVVPVLVAEDAATGEHEISAAVRFQACDDRLCEMPTDTRASTTVTVADESGEPGAHLDAENAALFSALLERHGGLPSVGEAAHAPAEIEVMPVARPSFFGINVPHLEGWLGLALLALFAAIGGFVLNLTPCVLPVIPIKIMTIIQHANSPGKNLILGLWMFFGVVAFWLALGLPVAFLTGLTDPSRLFSIWWLTLGIGILIALMGIGIMGMFTIQLPNAVYAVNPKADTAGGSFLFGVMTGVLGLPCFGFVAGALLAGAATMPPSQVLTIFTALGIGMGLPYLVLSLKPALVERLPRTGPASELVKQVMGLLLLAAAAYFIGSGLIALVSERPYMGRQLHWWAIALFAVLASVWLIVRTFQITAEGRAGAPQDRKSGAIPRTFAVVTGLVVGGVALVYASDTTLKERNDWTTYQAALAEAGGTGGYVQGVWNPWTPASFEQARGNGHIVVIDFTAEWCLNCKALKAAVLDRDPVRSLLNKDDVVKFTVDLTSRRGPGRDFMENELGQTGIPLLAIYTPGRDDPWLANAYTSQEVVAALEQARSQRVAQR